MNRIRHGTTVAFRFGHFLFALFLLIFLVGCTMSFHPNGKASPLNGLALVATSANGPINPVVITPSGSIVFSEKVAPAPSQSSAIDLGYGASCGDSTIVGYASANPNVAFQTSNTGPHVVFSLAVMDPTHPGVPLPAQTIALGYGSDSDIPMVSTGSDRNGSTGGGGSPPSDSSGATKPYAVIAGLVASTMDGGPAAGTAPTPVPTNPPTTQLREVGTGTSKDVRDLLFAGLNGVTSAAGNGYASSGSPTRQILLYAATCGAFQGQAAVDGAQAPPPARRVGFIQSQIPQGLATFDPTSLAGVKLSYQWSFSGNQQQLTIVPDATQAGDPNALMAAARNLLAASSPAAVDPGVNTLLQGIAQTLTSAGECSSLSSLLPAGDRAWFTNAVGLFNTPCAILQTSATSFGAVLGNFTTDFAGSSKEIARRLVSAAIYASAVAAIPNAWSSQADVTCLDPNRGANPLIYQTMNVIALPTQLVGYGPSQIAAYGTPGASMTPEGNFYSNATSFYKEFNANPSGKGSWLLGDLELFFNADSLSLTSDLKTVWNTPYSTLSADPSDLMASLILGSSYTVAPAFVQNPVQFRFRSRGLMGPSCPVNSGAYCENSSAVKPKSQTRAKKEGV